MSFTTNKRVLAPVDSDESAPEDVPPKKKQKLSSSKDKNRSELKRSFAKPSTPTILTHSQDISKFKQIYATLKRLQMNNINGLNKNNLVNIGIPDEILSIISIYATGRIFKCAVKQCKPRKELLILKSKPFIDEYHVKDWNVKKVKKKDGKYKKKTQRAIICDECNEKERECSQCWKVGYSRDNFIWCTHCEMDFCKDCARMDERLFSKPHDDILCYDCYLEDDDPDLLFGKDPEMWPSDYHPDDSADEDMMDLIASWY